MNSKQPATRRDGIVVLPGADSDARVVDAHRRVTARAGFRLQVNKGRRHRIFKTPRGGSVWVSPRLQGWAFHLTGSTVDLLPALRQHHTPTRDEKDSQSGWRLVLNGEAGPSDGLTTMLQTIVEAETATDAFRVTTERARRYPDLDAASVEAFVRQHEPLRLQTLHRPRQFVVRGNRRDGVRLSVADDRPSGVSRRQLQRFIDDADFDTGRNSYLTALVEHVLAVRSGEQQPRTDRRSTFERAREGTPFERISNDRSRSKGLRNAALEQLGRQCQCCGLIPEVDLGVRKGLLHVHHVNPVRLGERETTLEDVLVLCPTCHAATHAAGNDDERLDLSVVMRLPLFRLWR